MSMLKNEHAHIGRRERNKLAKLQRIEAAARELFAKDGYENTTTRAIATAADVATGTFFVYFPNKVHLLVHLYERDLGALTDGELDAIPEGTPVIDACMRVFDAVYDFYEKDQALACSFVKEMMFLKVTEHPDMLNTTMRYLGRLTALIDQAKERGEVRQDLGSPLAAQQLFAIYYWGLVTWLGPGLMTREQLSLMTRMSLEQLMRGLATS
jgi:AcrR family transcriptional regulator